MPDGIRYTIIACYALAAVYLFTVVSPLRRRLGEAPLNEAQRQFQSRFRVLGYGGVTLFALAMVALARALWPIDVAQGIMVFISAFAVVVAPLEGWCAQRMLALAGRS